MVMFFFLVIIFTLLFLWYRHDTKIIQNRVLYVDMINKRNDEIISILEKEYFPALIEGRYVDAINYGKHIGRDIEIIQLDILAYSKNK